MKKKFYGFFDEDEGSIAKAAIYYIICQVLVKGLSFITTPIFSRMLTKVEYGDVSNFFAWLSLLIPLVTLNLRVTINRSKYLYNDDNDTFLSTILAVSNVITLAVLIVIELNQPFFVELFSMSMRYIRILFIYIVFQTAFDYQQIQYNIYHKYKRYVFYTLLSVISSLLLSVILVILMENQYEGRIYGAVIPAIIVNAIIYINIWKRGKKIKLSYARFAIVMAVPLIPSALSNSILYTSDRIMITNFCGSEQTALYSVAYSISSIAGLLWSAINQAWGPWLYDHLHEEKYEEVRKFSNSITFIYVALVVGNMLFSPEILYIMGGQAYMSTISVMPPIILSLVFQFFYAFYFNAEYFYGETYIISLGTGIAAVVNIVLNLLLIPKYGYIAAAYTTMIGYAIMLLYHYLVVKIKLKKEFIFDNIFFLKVILTLIIVQILIYFLYEHNIIRYAVIMIYGVIISCFLWRYRLLLNEKIKSLLHK